MRRIWDRTGIDTARDYVLLLIESDSGDREFEIRDLSSRNEKVIGGRCVHATEIVPIDLVVSRDIFGIAEKVKLLDGSGFGFDSNGRWFTDQEFGDFKRKF
jgi:hypothetical protein